MLTKDFYNIIDGEIESLLEKYQDDDFIKKHKSARNNQKSYALLIWFLAFYGKKSNYENFITDGSSDSSCDIVFDNILFFCDLCAIFVYFVVKIRQNKLDKTIRNQGDKIFYAVQSKWNLQVCRLSMVCKLFILFTGHTKIVTSE